MFPTLTRRLPALLLAPLLLAAPAQAADIFVDASASGNNDGRRWEDAFVKLQDAIAAAADGDVIWVAAGIYYPDEGAGIPNNDPGISFAVRKQISIYGGFRSGAESLEESDPLANLTVLSGDIDQNDGDTNGDGIPNSLASVVGTNAETVLTLANLGRDEVIHGLYVVGGDGTSGAGVTLTNCFHLQSACYIRFNRATGTGGGLLVDRGAPMLVDGNIADNAAQNGGGLYADQADLTIENVDIDRNDVSQQGGALHANDSSVTLDQVDFRLNVANGEGGAVYFFALGSDTLDLDRCRIENNSSDLNDGGGLFADNGSVTAVNCLIRGNSSRSDGGGLAYTDATVTLTNCLVSGNKAGTPTVVALGGGIHSSGSSTTTAINCTFTRNEARGLAAFSGNGGDFVSTIIWDNTTTVGQSDISTTNSNTFSHCLVEGFDLSGSNGNLDGSTSANDPLFLAPTANPAPTTAGDYTLQSLSPCVDRGDTGAYPGPGTDLLGSGRFFDGDLDTTAQIDLGPYEMRQNPLVDSDGDGLPDAYERANTTPSSATALAALGDPDDDGRETLLEFATGTDPNVFNPDSPLTIVLNNDNRAVLNHTVSNYALNFVDLVLESSTDLGQGDLWAPAPVTQGFVSISPDVDVVVSTATHTASSPTATQYRLRAEKK